MMMVTAAVLSIDDGGGGVAAQWDPDTAKLDWPKQS